MIKETLKGTVIDLDGKYGLFDDGDIDKLQKVLKEFEYKKVTITIVEEE